MKVILIGEDHLSSQGPNLLLEIVLDLKQKEMSCAIGLEIADLDQVDDLYFTTKIKEENLLFAQLRRKLFINQAMSLFPAFAADLANKEKELSVRDDIMASEIFDSSNEVVVMLVGALHLEGIAHHLQNRGVEVMCLAPRHFGMMYLFPNVTQHVIKHGFFYSLEQRDLSQAKQRVNQFFYPNAINLSSLSGQGPT